MLKEQHELKPFSSISVIGLGYIGLPTAAILASKKIPVVGLEIDQKAIESINKGKIHIVEPELDILVHACVSEGYLKATDTPESADAFIISVPTPLFEDNQPDLSYIKAAAHSIAPVVKKGDLIILESTSPVGTTEQVADWINAERPDLTFPKTHGIKSDIRVAYCPERVLPGHILHELVQNNRIIGGMTAACSERAIQLYKIFVEGECIVTNNQTAEMCKLTENSFRDVNIAFANELSMICDKQNINVWELIQLANCHPRVNILQPGPGVGGHCIAVDPWFIISKNPKESRLLRTARGVNLSKSVWVIQKIKDAIDLYLQDHPEKTNKDITIACLGIAFKPNIDDLRESPALEITENLANLHSGPVYVVEPNIRVLPNKLMGLVQLKDLEDALLESDFIIKLVNHRSFSSLEKYMDRTGKILINVSGK